MFVPGMARLPSDLQSLEPPAYYTSQLHLSQFTEPHLLPSLSSRSLCGLSVDSRVDTDCVYALLPSGLCTRYHNSIPLALVSVVFLFLVPMYCLLQEN